MCLGIPGQVRAIWGDDTLRTGQVDFGGVTKDVCLSYLPEVRVGEYVIVHVGFAISRVDEEEARKTLEILAAMGDLVTTELSEEVPDQRAAAVPGQEMTG
jgi:hydrogenase expression/formation protein HypC